MNNVPENDKKNNRLIKKNSPVIKKIKIVDEREYHSELKIELLWTNGISHSIVVPYPWEKEQVCAVLYNLLMWVMQTEFPEQEEDEEDE